MEPPCGCTHCFQRRLATVDGLVRLGAWASGHAIIGAMLDCAGRRGCAGHADCAVAAQTAIADIRRRLAPDPALLATG